MGKALDRLLTLPKRRRVRYEEAGAVVLPPNVFSDLEGGFLHLADVAVLALVLSAFEARKPFLPGDRFDDDGETLVFTGGDRLLEFDPEQRVKLDISFRHLHAAHWLDVGKKVTIMSGRKWERQIRLGRLALEANAKRADIS